MADDGRGVIGETHIRGDGLARSGGWCRALKTMGGEC